MHGGHTDNIGLAVGNSHVIGPLDPQGVSHSTSLGLGLPSESTTTMGGLSLNMAPSEMGTNLGYVAETMPTSSMLAMPTLTPMQDSSYSQENVPPIICHDTHGMETGHEETDSPVEQQKSTPDNSVQIVTTSVQWKGNL